MRSTCRFFVDGAIYQAGGIMNDLQIKTVEKTVDIHLRDIYGIEGGAATVINGVNWTLRVGSTEHPRAFVRLYRLNDRPTDDVAAEMAVLNAIQPTGVLRVSRPIEDLSGCWFSEISLPLLHKMTRIMGVFSPAKGIEPEGSLYDYQRIGQALADLHRQKHLAKIVPNRNPGPGAGSNTIVCRSSALVAAIAAAAKSLEEKGAIQHLGPVGFCHGDIRLSNLRISNEHVTPFDFDDCGLGPQLLDVAAIAFWLEVGKQNNSASLWAGFLEGYGIKPSRSLGLAVQWLVLMHQQRAFQWLLDYCALTDALWQEVVEDAIRVAVRAGTARLKIFQDQ